MVQHADIDHTGLTGVGAGANPQVTTIELGHASDTTLARVSAGVVSIEGTNIVKAGAATGSGLTMATARLLGRTTASTGAIEEITVGSGLSLAAGALTATGGGGATVATVDEILSADVTMTTAGTFYDGPSGSFATGIWLVMWKAIFLTSGTALHQYSVKLWDGSTVYDQSANEWGSNNNGYNVEVFGFAIVTLGSTTTLKISGTSDSNTQVMKRDVAYSSAGGHTATRLVGYKVT